MSQGDGEKELILGNKQLVSLFFVVVALCGVVFAMGYMIGRNSTKPVSAMADGTPPVIEPGQRKQPDGRREEAAQTDPSPVPVPDSPAATQPAPSEQVSTPPTIAETEKSVADKSKPAVEPAPKEYRAATEADSGGALSKPQAETSYWQVVAYSKKTDADGVVKTLRDAKFPVILHLMPDNLYHVLVGPYKSSVALSDGKTKLKVLGFGGPLLKKF